MNNYPLICVSEFFDFFSVSVFFVCVVVCVVCVCEKIVWIETFAEMHSSVSDPFIFI
jgi:ABC-type siderophore export system fused ATPase/permease subunit